MQPGTDFILQALVAEGVDHLFMVPGGLIDPFLPALARQCGITPIVAVQEGGAAYMADGYARASGNMGAALAIGGPGLANTVTAVATAQTDDTPLLLLSGEVSTQIEGAGQFQDASAQTLDDVAILKPITRYSSSVDNSKALPRLVRRAFLHLRAKPSGPVHLSLPRDCLTDDLDAIYAPITQSLADPQILSKTGAEASLQHFASGPTKIVILAGAGVAHGDAAALLIRFAETYQIPVATTLRAKGVFPEDHPLSLGVFGYAGTHHARMALTDAPPDLLIVLGSGLDERDTMHWSLNLMPARTISVNLSTSAIGEHSEDGGVIGDCGAYLDFLLSKTETISQGLEQSIAPRLAWLAGIRDTPRLQEEENTKSAAVPIHPARIIAELRHAFPRDGILLIDSGAHRAFAGHYWESYTPHTYISATNLGPMGWAIAAACGVQCAQPDRRVAVITGDGCMRMQGMEIATAARYQLPVIFVVINNASLGNVWLRAHELGPVPDELTRLPDHDWATFAQSLGCRGETVRTPDELEGAFNRALAGKGPCVVDIKADKNCKTPVQDWAQAVAAYSYHE